MGKRLRLIDWLLGPEMVEHRVIRFAEVIVALPESDYPATVEMYERWTRRPRWPFGSKRMMGKLRFTEEVPMLVPGDSAVFDGKFSFTYPAKRPGDVSAELSRLIVEMRQKAASCQMSSYA